MVLLSFRKLKMVFSVSLLLQLYSGSESYQSGRKKKAGVQNLHPVQPRFKNHILEGKQVKPLSKRSSYGLKLSSKH